MFADTTSGGTGAAGTSNRSAASIISDVPEADVDPDTAQAGTSHPASWQDVTLADVYAARERIMPHLHRTPMLSSDTLGHMTGTRLGLKAEVFQKTGSFKSRGALNAAMQLTPEQRARGVVTLSAGNHGQGLAFAASIVGTRVVVFTPKTAVPTKVEAIRNYGAEIHFTESMGDIFQKMEEYRIEHDLTFVSPYDNAAIIAGQGTVGLEILEDLPDVETIVVPVGGGGLLAGVAMTVKSLRPDVRVVGVEPKGANKVRKSLDSGHLELTGPIETVADGLSAPFAGRLSQAVIHHYVDDVVLLDEAEIIDAMRLILERVKVLVEPSGAAAVAGLLGDKVGARSGGQAVAILTGGNVDREKLKRLL